MFRIHITGASGAGTSTLGKALAETLGCAFFDTDDYYWEKSTPPFQIRTEVDTRLRKMHIDLSATKAWVLSGSLDGWGDALIPLFDIAIFVRLDGDARIKRLQQREFERYGDTALPGGELYQSSQEFLNWSAAYDSSHLPGRSLQRHEAWLTQLPCPVLRIFSDNPVQNMVQELLESTALKALFLSL